MKKQLAILFLTFMSATYAQQFEIPVIKHPYFDVIEWKGIGAIAMSRDPSLTQRQVDLVMVSGDGKSAWQQVYNPIVKEPYFISEDGGKYAYFLENLELNSGKVYLHQLNASGNIKVMNVNFLSTVKSLGMSPSDLYLTDIITTQRALVWTFTHRTKEKLTTVAISMTHHNFNTYGFVVSEVPIGSSKVEEQIAWYLAGEKGENILFVARVHAGKSAGWVVKEFNPKGQLVSTLELDQKGTDFIAHSRVGFGRRGSALLKRSEPNEKGTLIYANGSFFVGGLVLEGSSANVVTYQLVDKEWKKHSQSPCGVYNPKKGIDVGVFNMEEGIGWFVQSGKSEGHFHSFTSSEGVVSGSIDQATANPSRLLTPEFPSKFVVELDTKWLVFDKTQLPSKGGIVFEYKQK